jgi:4-amino-4-deoxy-L-arabinose transferase-like glycosyltransferase
VHNAPFYLFVAGAFTFLTIPRMAQAGMFLDGMMYAAIARNLAEGVGTFWLPSYSAVDPGFHEQPPLGMALQAAAFAVFGDHLAVERAYAFVVAGLTALLIASIWRQTVGERAFDWLPIVFWLLPSTVTWAIVNNMLETTQTVFTTTAVLAFVMSLRHGLAWAIASGLCVIAAVLTKGPAGFFPIAVPIVAAVVLRQHRSASIRSGLVMLASIAGAAALILSSSAVRLSLRSYADTQLLSTIRGTRGGGRWPSLARHLGGGIFLRMGGLLLIAWIMRVRTASSNADPIDRRWVAFLWCIALCASLPLVVSARITGHYLLPAVPLFALAFAGTALPFLRPRLDAWRQHVSVRRAFSTIGVTLLVASAAIPLSGGALERRDAAWVAEYQSLGGVLPRRETLGTCEAIRTDWGVHAYLQRFYGISLDPAPKAPRRYFLLVTDRPCEGPAGCRQIAATNRLAVLDCAREAGGSASKP